MFTLTIRDKMTQEVIDYPMQFASKEVARQYAEMVTPWVKIRDGVFAGKTGSYSLSLVSDKMETKRAKREQEKKEKDARKCRRSKGYDHADKSLRTPEVAARMEANLAEYVKRGFAFETPAESILPCVPMQGPFENEADAKTLQEVRTAQWLLVDIENE